MHKIGIVGHTGMVGQELQKVLANHDKVEIVYRKNSTSEEGSLKECDLVFLATRDEESMGFLSTAMVAGVKVIDMSGAYRLSVEDFEKWYGIKHTSSKYINEAAYGLPAVYFDQIKDARLVANPGCYPTAVVLALRPLRGLVWNDISIVATSGNSGARRECDEISDDITYSYGRKHKHVPEIERYSGFKVDFTPIVLRSVFKGINANIRADLSTDLKGVSDESARQSIEKAIENEYCEDDRVFIVHDSADKQYGTKDVNDTHDMLIKVRVENGRAYINVLIDNLMKGAASQGVENMNIMLGIERLYGIITG